VSGASTLNGVNASTLSLSGTATLSGGVTLPTSYTTSPAAGKLGNILTGAGTLTVPLSNTITSVANVALTPGVWILHGVLYWYATSTNTVTSISAGISTSNSAYDGGSIQNITLTTGVTFGTEAVNCTRFMYVSANTTMYLVGSAFFTDTLGMNAGSTIYAIRIA
jgi:hypothetical protein